MHEDLQFPMQCSFRQTVYKNYSWKGDRLTSGDGSIFRRYDAFGRPDLIPSLVRLVKDTTNTERARKAAMYKWVKRLGWLTVPPNPPALLKPIRSFGQPLKILPTCGICMVSSSIGN